MLLAISAIVGRFLCCGYICALGVEKVGAPRGRVLWLPAFVSQRWSGKVSIVVGVGEVTVVYIR
jgi:hypothetical protein